MDNCFIIILVILLFGLLTIHCYNLYEDFKQSEGYVFIADPFGRFGNNVKQLLNAMVVCQEKGYKLKLGSRYRRNIDWLFNVDEMVENFNKTINWTKSKSPNLIRFYYVRSEIGRVPNSRDHFTFSEKFLIPFIKIKLTPKDSDTLYIHIRSGDIFKDNGGVNPEYVQPPLSYFTKIIKETDYPKIIIITEADMRTCYK